MPGGETEIFLFASLLSDDKTNKTVNDVKSYIEETLLLTVKPLKH